MKAVRISAAEIARAKQDAETAGLRLKGIEKRQDGSLKFEFSDPEEHDNANWFAGGPLYRDVA